jgi:acyl carrier protein
MVWHPDEAIEAVSLASAASVRAPEHPAADSSTEACLAHIWSDVLGVQDVGLDDTFIDLGGHSLTAIHCLNRVKDLFQVDLPITVVLLDAPTVRTMAALVEERRRSAGAAPPGQPRAKSVVVRAARDA